MIFPTAVRYLKDLVFTARGATFTATGAPNFRQVGDVTITGFFEQVELDYDITGAVDRETGSPAHRASARWTWT